MTLPTRRRGGPGLLVLLIGLAMAGCTMTTNGIDSTMAMHVPVVMPGPPPRIVPPATPSPSGPPPNGRFDGTGRLSSSAGSGCRTSLPVSGLMVSGNKVRYHGFHGTIQSDGFVRMQSGAAYLYGIFDGPNFDGHLWRPHPQCTYDLALTHIG